MLFGTSEALRSFHALGVEIEENLALVLTVFGGVDEPRKFKRNSRRTSAVRQVRNSNALVGHFSPLSLGVGSPSVAEAGESARFPGGGAS